MWSLVFGLLAWVLGLFGFGKTDERDKERQAGERTGRLASGLEAADQALGDVARAQSSRDRLDSTPGGVVSDPNNTGPD